MHHFIQSSDISKVKNLRPHVISILDSKKNSESKCASDLMSTHLCELHGDMPALIVDNLRNNLLSVDVLEEFGFEVHLTSKFRCITKKSHAHDVMVRTCRDSQNLCMVAWPSANAQLSSPMSACQDIGSSVQLGNALSSPI